MCTIPRPVFRAGYTILMDNTAYYAMYVIGTVESSCDWGACNYVDAITMGMMQWYGNRAWNLLERGRTADPSGWATFATAAPTLARQVQSNDIDWTSRYLSTAEGNAWKAWAQHDENHAFQEAQWEADWGGYQSTMTNFGFPSDNVKERIMWACAYHQSPARAQRVLASCSATATLELIYTTILADGVLGQYRNRYTTAYDLLNTWDGSSAPPDFGQTSEPSDKPGGDRPGIDGKPGSTAWIQLQGDNLILHDGGTVSVFMKSSAQTWVHKTSGSTKPSGGQTGGGSGSGSGSEDAARVVEWLRSRIGRYAYSQGAGRLDPDSSGYGDCSSVCWRAYQDVLGIDVGTWTGQMADRGTRVCGSSDTNVSDAIRMAHAADLLLLDWGAYTQSWDHVEMFTGDGKDETLSHGGPGNGPNLFAASGEMNMASRWEIRRYIAG